MAGAALLLALGASIEGCGKPVLRVADASLGDYYTDQEFRKLSRADREEYCASLARQDSIYRAQVQTTQEDLAASRARALALRQEGDSLFALASGLDEEARREASTGSKNEGAPPRAGGETHVVRSGESLWRISAGPSAYGRGARWSRIYEANRDRIRNPDRIYPGQELIIPR
jgi:nucleoid-associated protein YgaU